MVVTSKDHFVLSALLVDSERGDRVNLRKVIINFNMNAVVANTLAFYMAKESHLVLIPLFLFDRII
ncbi:hypothetical protein [uncultured Roseobacter sp.]|uniref:hypothetical protein n=1 Tax=uncultured Roseobacter sp. TaxID=114847 RepID=UPI002632F86B|nr:hypothetical protein [uncultured Roseobacter sp.]